VPASAELEFPEAVEEEHVGARRVLLDPAPGLVEGPRFKRKRAHRRRVAGIGRRAGEAEHRRVAHAEELHRLPARAILGDALREPPYTQAALGERVGNLTHRARLPAVLLPDHQRVAHGAGSAPGASAIEPASSNASVASLPG
jgi:hypothetical protein